MIITVESVSRGTAGQLPACLPALLPYCHPTLAAFFVFFSRATMQYSDYFSSCQDVSTIMTFLSEYRIRNG